MFDSDDRMTLTRQDLRAYLNGVPEPVLMLDRDLNILVANDASEAQFAGDPTGQPLVNVLRWPEVLQCAKDALAQSEGIEIVIRSPDVAQVTWNIHATPLRGRSTDMPTLMLSMRDVSHVKAAERMRSVFVANVSHELRSPLTALSGFIETLKGAASDDPDARVRFLDIMEREATRMDRLIDDLLSLSEIEVNRHIQPSASVDLEGVVAEVVDILEHQEQVKGRGLVVEAEADCAHVLGDAVQLSQVVRNLVENALRYGEEGTPVTVKVSRMDKSVGMPGATVRLDVSDRGPGIAPEQIPRLTERFYRVDEARSREKGGTGLGLAIVKHIVHRHRGRMTIQSELGTGTTFSVFLPTPSSLEV